MRSPRSVSPSTSQDPGAGRGLAGGRLLPDFPEAKTKSCRLGPEPPCVQEVSPMRAASSTPSIRQKSDCSSSSEPGG